MMVITPLRKEHMLQYVGYAVDDAANECPATAQAIRQNRVRHCDPSVRKARIVGWTCGFEPMCVAVFSYLPDVRLDDDEAIELAVNLLLEKGWFADPSDTAPDFVL